MRSNLLILALSCLLCATACDEKSPVGPTVPLNQEFTLGRWQAASIQDTSVTVQFVGVSGDNRCPADVACIQGGDAIVHLRAGDDEYELHTGDLSRAAVTHAGVRIELVNLQPYPFSSRTLGPDEYRATLRATQ